MLNFLRQMKNKIAILRLSWRTNLKPALNCQASDCREHSESEAFTSFTLFKYKRNSMLSFFSTFHLLSLENLISHSEFRMEFSNPFAEKKALDSMFNSEMNSKAHSYRKSDILKNQMFPKHVDVLLVIFFF